MWETQDSVVAIVTEDGKIIGIETVKLNASQIVEEKMITVNYPKDKNGNYLKLDTEHVSCYLNECFNYEH